MKKIVEDYMKLPYTIEITPDSGSYFIKVKELEGCMTVGETKVEALDMIEDAKRAWFEAVLEDGGEIPLPDEMREEKYSGKFALRLPKSQHKKLAEAAQRDGVSLNQYIVTLLAENNSFQAVRELLQKQSEETEIEPEVVGSFTVKRPQRKVIPFGDRKVRLTGVI